MELTEKLDFDHPGREDICKYIASRGPTRPEKIRRALNMGERAFGHHTVVLKRDSILEEADGRLRIAFGSDEEAFEATLTNQ